MRLAFFDTYFNNHWQNTCKMAVLSVCIGLTACQNQSNNQTEQSTASQTASTQKPTNQSPAIIIASTAHEPASTTASITEQTPTTSNQLTVYTSLDKKSLEPLFAKFSKQTGIMVNLVQDEPMSILAKLQAEGDNSPADMILTEDIGVLHHGIEHNLLQPFNAEKAITQVPARFQDPDAHWLVLSYYGRLAVFNSKTLSANNISSFNDLAKPKWYKKLCLSQRSFTPNQSFVVDIMHQLGEKKAKEVLQGYINNLAMPVVLDDKAILQAIDSGKCQIGMVNSQSFVKYQQDNPKTLVHSAWINADFGGVHTNAIAIAMPRTAHQPELALKLTEWLADKEQIGLFASISHSFPLNEQVETSALLKSWGEFKPSQIDMTEYGEKQKAAIELMQSVNYN